MKRDPNFDLNHPFQEFLMWTLAAAVVAIIAVGFLLPTLEVYDAGWFYIQFELQMVILFTSLCMWVLMGWTRASIFKPRLFDYSRNGDANPYRRHCRRCGQCQVYAWEFGSTGWWEDMSPVPDEECKCHRHSRYVP